MRGDAESDRRVALGWMMAATNGDERAALALSAPSFLYTNGNHLRRYEGHDGVRDIVEDFNRLSGFLTVSVLESIAEPGLVAMTRCEKYILPQGAVEIPACSFVEVRDGLVVRWSDYKDLHILNRVSD